MNVIFTCGGTGGHIMPAIAVANILKQRHPDSKILFIGGEGGMEETLVPKAGYELKVLPAGGLSRGKNLQAIKQNLRAAKKVQQALKRSKQIIKEFKPDVIVGTGGYASFAAIWTGARMGIPTCVHESNAMPGLTTRMLSGKVDRVLVCFPESVQHFRDPKKVEVVGMPVREEFIFTEREAARKELGIGDQPVIVTAFGSQGAKVMNEITGKLFRLEQDAGFPYRHIHAVGSYGWGWMPDYVKDQGVDLTKTDAVTMQEYIYNMPTVMAAADIVISRAGASSCNEIAASGTPCILIPSPNVTDNHQEKNARAMEREGAAEVILEKDCSAELLMQRIQALLGDPAYYSKMRNAQLNMVVPDSAARLCTIMEQLAGK